MPTKPALSMARRPKQVSRERLLALLQTLDESRTALIVAHERFEDALFAFLEELDNS